jgi:hypothetical protein
MNKWRKLLKKSDFILLQKANFVTHDLKQFFTQHLQEKGNLLIHLTSYPAQQRIGNFMLHD